MKCIKITSIIFSTAVCNIAFGFFSPLLGYADILAIEAIPTWTDNANTPVERLIPKSRLCGKGVPAGFTQEVSNPIRWAEAVELYLQGRDDDFKLITPNHLVYAISIKGSEIRTRRGVLVNATQITIVDAVSGQVILRAISGSQFKPDPGFPQ